MSEKDSAFVERMNEWMDEQANKNANFRKKERKKVNNYK